MGLLKSQTLREEIPQVRLHPSAKLTPAACSVDGDLSGPVTLGLVPLRRARDSLLEGDLGTPAQQFLGLADVGPGRADVGGMRFLELDLGTAAEALFDQPDQTVLDDLKQIEFENVTPLQALQILKELQDRLNG